MNNVAVGIDVGGTFTDLVLVDGDSGQVVTGKLLTTPRAPDEAILNGLGGVLVEAAVTAAAVQRIVHGTTLVTNTLIERTGARVGLITTRGFRDSLEMGREIRYDLYDLFLEPAPVLVPRRRRLGVPGRISPAGEELEAFDEAAFRVVARELVETQAVEALAVCFMHAYRNPAHERRAGEILAAAYPDLPFSLSHDVAPEIREFERASTAVANAYVQPRMRGYLARLEAALAEREVGGRLYVMLSAGGIAGVSRARRLPIELIESGPAAGAMAACHHGMLAGEPDLISFDMGGTTAKMCLIEGGRPQRTHDFEAGRVRRFKRGSGIPLKVAVVDMIEIGAGGGSIASVDGMGLLKVGPRSAGSEPGPACYGRGGEDATVTDADLLLGYLDAQQFLGGEMALDEGAAAAAVAALAQALAMDVQSAARGVHEVVNENMAAATRRYLAEKGKDPRRYALMAFGGAGPVHACALAALLKIRRVVVPYGAGVASALGFLVAPPAVEVVRSLVGRLDLLDWSEVEALYAEMEAEARQQLAEAGARDGVTVERQAELRHVGQGFEIPVPVPGDQEGIAGPDALRDAFFDTYEMLFERRVDDVAVEAMTWRLTARAQSPVPALRFAAGDAPGSGSARGEREVTFADRGRVSAAVWSRADLRPGDRFEGPAVVEERESTTVVPPGAAVCVDEHLNLIIDLG